MRFALERGVAHPRRIVPGETYLVTRRCAQRALRLRPSAETNRIFLYCLAFAAKCTGVQIHAACEMSNHHHLVVTDVYGVLPIFLREFHRLTAKAMNSWQGQWENLWAAEHCNVVRLVTDEDIEDKIAYVVSNPVAAGLVGEPDEWPGVVLWGERVVRAPRPGAYFHKDGTCPEELALRIVRPVARGGALRGNDWRARVGRSIRLKVTEARHKMVGEGRRFLGRAAVLAGSFTRNASSYEGRFGVIPTFAAKARNVRDHLRRVERHFRACYRGALERWRAGFRDAVFPVGTWRMLVEHGAAVELDGCVESPPCF